MNVDLATEKYMADILTKAGHKSGADAANKIIALEKDIAAKHLSRVESRDSEKNYNKQSATQVKELLGSFDWQTYADDLVGNYIRYSTFDHFEDTNKIGKPVDKADWGMTPQTINAYYHPVRNEIVFPAGILQPPFFDMKVDDAVHYGAIGAVIGHEIGHGFDDQGSKYDSQGNLRSWWTDEDRAAFDVLGKKLVARFNKFEPIEGQSVNGIVGNVDVFYQAFYLKIAITYLSLYIFHIAN
jgi:predicted metalloendopeptidase